MSAESPVKLLRRHWAQCRTFNSRSFKFNGTGVPDPTLNTTYLAATRQQLRPRGGNGIVLADLHPTAPDGFDNKHFSNLQANRGLLRSDQELFSTPGADDIFELVYNFAANQTAFFKSFVVSMIRMGQLSPSTGTGGEIRLNCSVLNENLTGPNNLLAGYKASRLSHLYSIDILLDFKFSAKVSDFGTSKLAPVQDCEGVASHMSTMVKGTRTMTEA
ncbi:unnamed protein product [Dovyalis caffra]|uniref:peroxidase n=1 Tax=Dovyalis caffra TaxID=77055 RepID=A0AAV1RR74_9ROSI|nr:unnamed protein product [Dovyalis caffra]